MEHENENEYEHENSGVSFEDESDFDQPPVPPKKTVINMRNVAFGNNRNTVIGGETLDSETNLSFYARTNKWLQNIFNTIEERFREPLFVVCAFGIFLLIEKRFKLNLAALITKITTFYFLTVMITLIPSSLRLLN